MQGSIRIIQPTQQNKYLVAFKRNKLQLLLQLLDIDIFIQYFCLFSVINIIPKNFYKGKFSAFPHLSASTTAFIGTFLYFPYLEKYNFVPIITFILFASGINYAKVGNLRKPIFQPCFWWHFFSNATK